MFFFAINPPFNIPLPFGRLVQRYILPPQLLLRKVMHEQHSTIEQNVEMNEDKELMMGQDNKT